MVVGLEVGKWVGSEVVGDDVTVGEVVGLVVGEVVGLRVGDTVGEVVGLVVGDTVGEVVGLTVGDVVGSEVVGDAVVVGAPVCADTVLSITQRQIADEAQAGGRRIVIAVHLFGGWV
jgi:hypothetical protein